MKRSKQKPATLPVEVTLNVGTVSYQIIPDYEAIFYNHQRHGALVHQPGPDGRGRIYITHTTSDEQLGKAIANAIDAAILDQPKRQSAGG